MSTSALGGQIRHEVAKLTTLRGTWWCLGTAVALSIPMCWLTAFAMSDEPGASVTSITRLALRTSVPALACVMVLAVGAMRSDVDCGIWRLSTLRARSRAVAWTAKALAVALLAAVAGVVLAAVATGVVATVLGQWDSVAAAAGHLVAMFACFALVMAGWSALGLAAGALLPTTGAALAVVLGMPLVVEPALGVSGGSWTQFLPFSAGFATLGNGSRFFETPPIGVAGSMAVFVATALAAVVAAGWRSTSTDL